LQEGLPIRVYAGWETAGEHAKFLENWGFGQAPLRVLMRSEARYFFAEREATACLYCPKEGFVAVCDAPIVTADYEKKIYARVDLLYFDAR